ncbi:MAG: YeeE/YedE family protein [Limibacillus sp.]|jgi:uncharacterized membrane protein YedE/YeeE
MISPDFTPWSGLAGGLLIGLAATLLLAFNGRIAGISGILSAVVERWSAESGWKLAFLLGLILGPFAYAMVFGAPPALTLQADGPGLVIAGLLVGFGTRLGSGCTSGHGVCGIARGSARSITATAVFIASAMATVFVLRHLV